MKQILAYSFAFVFLGLVGCSKSGSSSDTVALAKPLTAKEAKAKHEVVNLAIWSNYLTDQQLAEFQKKTGIKIQVSNYSSNEELLAKLQAGASGFDVAVPSDYMVKAMNELSLLETIHKDAVPNSKTLEKNLTGLYYDPKNEVSLPFGWGTTGIAVNTKLVKAPITGWKDFFETKSISGKYTMLDDVREALGAALKSEALSLNSTSNDALGKAKGRLLTAKNSVKGFTSETLDGLVNGEMSVAQAYSVDALQASAKTHGAIQYVLPKEGYTLWIDNVVIPKGAKNLTAAHQLIDFLLSAKVGADRTSRLFTGPANTQSLALLSPALKANKGLFPDKETLARSEMLKDLGDSLNQWDRIWTEVKAAK